MPVSRTRASSCRNTVVRGRSASRLPVGSSASSTPGALRRRGRWRPAAARRPKGGPAGGSARSSRPTMASSSAARAAPRCATGRSASAAAYVLQRREFRQQVVDTDRRSPGTCGAASYAAGRPARRPPCRQHDLAAVRPLQQSGDVQQGRLAAARLADQRHDLAGARSSETSRSTRDGGRPARRCAGGRAARAEKRRYSCRNPSTGSTRVAAPGGIGRRRERQDDGDGDHGQPLLRPHGRRC